jgi:hypothetical protein
MPDVIGLGGSLRAASTSRAALQVALDGAAAAGAATRLLWFATWTCRCTRQSMQSRGPRGSS